MILAWFVVGAGIGWYTCFGFDYFGGTAVGKKPKSLPATHPFLISIYSIWALFVTGTTAEGGDQSEAVSGNVEGQRNRVLGLLFLSLAILIVAVALAISFDDLLDTREIYQIEGLISKGRLVSLVVGAVFGIEAYIKRNIIRDLLIGSADGSAENKEAAPIERKPWLQWALGALGLFLVIGLFDPKILDRIKSFRAGEVEAKFEHQQNTSSSALQTIRFKSKDAYVNQSLVYWSSFLDAYIGDAHEPEDCVDVYKRKLRISSTNNNTSRPENGSFNPIYFADARRSVIFDFSSEQDLNLNNRRLDIACQFFVRLDPVLQELRQRYDKGEIDLSKHDEVMVEVAYDFRRFILDPSDRSAIASAFKKLQLKSDGRLVRNNDRESLQFIDARHALIVKNEAKFIDEIARSPNLIDPYLVGLVGDMLGFYSNLEKEAEFLNEVARKYPSDIRHIHPGLVNFYFAMASSKLMSEVDWKLEDITADLRNADLMNGEIIHRASARIADERNCRALDDRASSSLGDLKLTDQLTYCNILNNYLLNFTDIEREHLELYIYYSVRGAPIDEVIRSEWVKHFKNLAAVVNATGDDAPKIDSMFPRHLSEMEKARLSQIRFDVGDKFNWYTHLALSAVLLTSNTNAAGQACAAARYYLKTAEDILPDWLIEEASLKENLGEKWPVQD